MIVVSNSSPLIALARIRQLDLLASLFQRILIPSEVQLEVTVAGRGLPGAEAGTRKGLVSDLRQAYVDLLRQGIRFDIGLLQDSQGRIGLPKL